MSNEKTERKLKHHEKPIWRDAFKESMRHTSIEGATRNAWKAVDEWNRAGAFNESQAYPVDLPAHVIDWEAAWNHLGETLHGCAESSTDWEDRLASAMLDYSKSELNIYEFKEEVDLIFRDPTE
jgi:hypothetical protein